jgi:hypothetical protein
MSQENVDVVREVLVAWNERDADRALPYLSPAIEWKPAGPAAVEGPVYRGHEEVAAATGSLWDMWDEFRFEEAEVRGPRAAQEPGVAAARSRA